MGLIDVGISDGMQARKLQRAQQAGNQKQQRNYGVRCRGANKGDGINFMQFGRFDHAGIDYDGPLGVNDGVSWLERSIKVKETFGNMYTKARMLAVLGKTQEAIAAGERALQLGKEEKANTADLEKRLAEWKAKT